MIKFIQDSKAQEERMHIWGFVVTWNNISKPHII